MSGLLFTFEGGEGSGKSTAIKSLGKFLLDIDSRIGLQRKKDAGKLDKIDSEDVGFHERVRNGYLREAKESNPERWIILDASLPKNELNKLIQEKVELKLMETGYLEGQRRRKES